MPATRYRADVFRVLAESAWLDDDLADRLAELAFPHLAGHRYAEVDDDRVVESLHTSLGDIEDYAAAVAAGLSGAEGTH